MLSSAFKKEDLKFFETTVEKQSLRLDCKLNCYLMAFDKQSSTLENRKHLREQLVQTIEKIAQKKLSLEQKKALLTPGKPPKIPFASVSISHCAFMGGFVISRLDLADAPSSPPESTSTERSSIGFDLEQLGRATEKTVLRISNKKEINQAPSSSALWSAKEAAYKSISSFQSDIHIKHILVVDWQCLSPIENTQAAKPNISKKPEWKKKELPKIYDYQFTIVDKDIEGKGVICCLKDMVIGLAFSKLKRCF